MTHKKILIGGGVAQLVEFDYDARGAGSNSTEVEKIFLCHSGGRITRLYTVGDPVDESIVEPVFAQLRHYKLTSYFFRC